MALGMLCSCVPDHRDFNMPDSSVYFTDNTANKGVQHVLIYDVQSEVETPVYVYCAGLNAGTANVKARVAEDYIDYYNKVTDGLIYTITLPDIAILSSVKDNVGSVRFYGAAELYAVYGNETAPDGPLVSVLTIKRTGTTMNVEVLRDLPDGYSVKEQGILFGTEATFGILAPEDAMVFNGADTFRYVSNGIAPTDVTGLTLRNVSGKIYARGYVIYLFGGAEAVIYTDVVSVE